jgi:hypothetical protein
MAYVVCDGTAEKGPHSLWGPGGAKNVPKNPMLLPPMAICGINFTPARAFCKGFTGPLFKPLLPLAKVTFLMRMSLLRSVQTIAFGRILTYVLTHF